MKGFRRICAAVIGTVFFAAGILKLMDPVGAGLVVEEYFKFLHLGFLKPAAEVTACFLSLVECAAGAALITGVWRRITAIVSGALIAVFTVITIILVIARPAMDCGCFGEAVHLSHLQTLLKNLILLALWLIAFMPFRDFGKPARIKYVSFGIAVLSAVLFLVYSLCNIPLRDYTDLRPGTELMGEVMDSEAQALYFCDASGEYADSLATRGKVMIVSAYTPGKLDAGDISKISSFCEAASANGFTPLFLAASTPEMMEEQVSGSELLSRTFYADRRLLLTLNRSNGGATCVSDGQIIAKWPSRSLPGDEELKQIRDRSQMDYMLDAQNRNRNRFQGFLLYAFAVMFLL